jgi:hypothetical protein
MATKTITKKEWDEHLHIKTRNLKWLVLIPMAITIFWIIPLIFGIEKLEVSITAEPWLGLSKVYMVEIVGLLIAFSIGALRNRLQKTAAFAAAVAVAIAGAGAVAEALSDD